MTRKILLFVLLGVLLPAAGRSQTAPKPAPKPPAAAGVSGSAAESLEVDPVRCWWRTSAGAVRIGETFTVVLTCAVLQTDAVQVVPDETRLDPTVAQMSPFEVTGGAHPTDIYSGNRRFFQCEYNLRVINPDVIGKDIKIPDPLIHYRINSTVAANAALEGREHNYLLPELSVRVISVVPADAPDIRDASKDTFAAVEQTAFRASVLQIVGVTAIALGILVLALAFVRLVMRARKEKSVGVRGVSVGAILRAASRELSAVEREVGAQGWNTGLVARALAAARIPAAVALDRPIHQYDAHEVEAGDGRLMTTRGLLKRTPTIICGAGTPQDLTRELGRLSMKASSSERQILEQPADGAGHVHRGAVRPRSPAR